MNNNDHPRVPRVLAVTIFGFLALPGCDEPQKVETPAPRPTANSDMVITPVDRTVIDNKGRKLEVQILARTGTHARVVRKSDGMKFDLIIKALSEDDQRFIYRIPETPIIGSINPDTYDEPDDTPSYIKNREDSIAQLEIKLEELRTELEILSSSAPRGGTSPRVRQKKKEIDQTNAEIARLDGQIAEYRAQNKE